jgi:hypothetical protein
MEDAMLSLSLVVARFAACRTRLGSILALTFALLPLSALADRTISVSVACFNEVPAGTVLRIKAYAPNGGHVVSGTANSPTQPAPPASTQPATSSLSQLSSEVYTVAVKGSKWLRKSVQVDVRTGNGSASFALQGSTSTENVLSGGDANNDNVVDNADLLLLVGCYNKTVGQTGFRDDCDFNCDGADDISDLIILTGNFNKVGDPDPNPPLSAFSLSTNETTGGNNVDATITLTVPAPAGGMVIKLRSTPANAFLVNNSTNYDVTFTPNQQTKTVTLNTGTVTHETRLMVIAEDVNQSGVSEAVLLKPVTLRITKIALDKVTLEWPSVNIGQSSYRLIRTHGGSSTTINNLTGTTYEDTTSWTAGGECKYELFAMVSGVAKPLATERAKFFVETVADNQTVDSRLDKRNSEVTFVDYKFNTSVFKGGLFTGYAKGSTSTQSDQSRTGRSLLKFTGLPNATNPQSGDPLYNMAFRTGSVAAYFVDFERRNAHPNSPTVANTPFDIYCQLTGSTWTPSTVNWTTAPPFNNVLIESQERKWKPSSMSNIGTWAMWEMGQGIIGAMRGNQTLAVMLYGKLLGQIGDGSEDGAGWAYFAKKEFDSTKAARVVHAWTYPTPYKFEYGGLNGNGNAHCGNALTVSLILNGLGIGDPGVSVTYTVTFEHDTNMSNNVVYSGTQTVTALDRVLCAHTPPTGNYHLVRATATCNGVTINTTLTLEQ